MRSRLGENLFLNRSFSYGARPCAPLENFCTASCGEKVIPQTPFQKTLIASHLDSEVIRIFYSEAKTNNSVWKYRQPHCVSVRSCPYPYALKYCINLGCPAPFFKGGWRGSGCLPFRGEVAPSGDRGSLHDAAIDRPKACIDARPKAGKADSDRLRAPPLILSCPLKGSRKL